METINAQTALELLDAAVELTGPEHLYELPENAMGCRYVHGENPGCIIGVALSIHGVPLDVMRRWDAEADTGVGITTIRQKGFAPFLTERAAAVFRAAQVRQDSAAFHSASDEAIVAGRWGAARDAARSQIADPIYDTFDDGAA